MYLDYLFKIIITVVISIIGGVLKYLFSYLKKINEMDVEINTKLKDLDGELQSINKALGYQRDELASLFRGVTEIMAHISSKDAVSSTFLEGEKIVKKSAFKTKNT